MFPKTTPKCQSYRGFCRNNLGTPRNSLNTLYLQSTLPAMDTSGEIQIDAIGLTILTISSADCMISLQISEGPIKMNHGSSTSVFTNDQLPIILELENGKSRFDIWDSSGRLVYSKRPINPKSGSFSAIKPSVNLRSPSFQKSEPEHRKSPTAQNKAHSGKEPRSNGKPLQSFSGSVDPCDEEDDKISSSDGDELVRRERPVYTDDFEATIPDDDFIDTEASETILTNESEIIDTDDFDTTVSNDSEVYTEDSEGTYAIGSDAEGTDAEGTDTDDNTGATNTENPGFQGTNDGTSRLISQRQAAFLAQLLKNLMSKPDARYFENPVNVLEMDVPDYFDIIQTPMDLSTILNKLTEGLYSRLANFISDFNLIVQNSVEYNGEGHRVTRMARRLETVFWIWMNHFLEREADNPGGEE